MKKFAKWIIGGVISTSFLAISSLASFQDINTKEVEGYTVSSLPTTIDLNDTTEANIRSYYSSLGSLATNQRQGTNLLKNLKPILKNGQKYYSYDSGSAIWQMYEITDRDWTKSPASSTTYGTYNSSTKKITNYVYGTGSGSSSKNNPYIHALYINRDVTNQTTAWDNHNQDQWGINREHVWPKAEGFDTSGAGGARGDPMHLMAGNGYANNIHSNYYYGYVKTSSSYTDCGSKYSNQSGNLRGTSKTLNSGTVFEPQDSDKGDIARAIFYMVARYNYLSGSDSDGIDSNNPNLTLTQNISDWASSGYSSTTSKTGKMGILTDLLNWHHQDPVDEYEIHRNNLLYTNYTNNRNPFIDFPEWVDYIWGTATYNGTTYSSYSSTPTGYANPSSDTINGYNSSSSDPISVTGVELNKSSTEIEVGSSEALTALVSPTNATNKALTWTSSDTSVATVSSGGRVTGVDEGTATITVTTGDGSFTDTCTVTVVESSGSGDGTEEGSITASDGSFSGWTSSGTGKYKDGSIKLDDAGDNVYKTSIFSGAISSGMTSLSVTLSGKMNLKQGYSSVGSNSTYKIEAFDTNGNVLAQTTKTGSDVFVTGDYKNATFTIDSNLNGCTGIKITYATQDGANWALASASWVATYSSESEVTLSSIVVKTPPSRTTYTAGDGFIASGLVITATYSDSSTAEISYDDDEDSFEFDPFDNLQTSDTSVTITYGGQTCSQAITVNSTKTLTNISISNYTTTYSLNAAFSFDGVCTATYSDTSSEPVTPTSVTSPNMEVVGVKTITVSYTYGGTTLTQEYTIEVVPTSSFTWDLTIDSYSAASTDQVSWTSDFVSMSHNRGSSQTTAANNYIPPDNSSTRFYTNNTLVFTPADSYQINSVVVTAVSSSYASKLTNSTWTNATAAVDGTTVTITPTDGTKSFYASILNGPVGVASVVVNYEYLTSATISASVSKTFYVGETISVSDIHVEDNYGTEITGFEFDNDGYMFVYTDAVSGGVSTSKTFANAIHYYNMDCSLTVNVQRKARFDTTKTTDTLDRSYTGVTGNSYTSWSNKAAPNSTAVYAGNNAGGNSSIQLRSGTSSGSSVHSGIISTTSGGLIHTVTISWNDNTAKDRTLDIYGKDSAYESVEDLYDVDKRGTLLGQIKKGTSTTLIVTGSYPYIGIRSHSDPMYLNSVSFSYGLDDTPLNLANYIMYEDTNNQCETKYDLAEGYFEDLTTAQRATFMTSNDYVVSTARERFLDWAKHEGKAISYSGGDYVVSSRQVITLFSSSFGNKNITPIIIVISLLGVTTVGGYFFLHKRKED